MLTLSIYKWSQLTHHSGITKVREISGRKRSKLLRQEKIKPRVWWPSSKSSVLVMGRLDWRGEIWTGNIIEFIELSLITHFVGSWRSPPPLQVLPPPPLWVHFLKKYKNTPHLSQLFPECCNLFPYSITYSSSILTSFYHEKLVIPIYSYTADCW